MAPEPSEDDIRQFCEVANLDYAENYGLVQNAFRSNNSLESLLIEYYENHESFRSKYSRAWDESAFAAGRDGVPTGVGASFNIETSDMAVLQGVTPPPDYWQRSAAPSRPPSRANAKSPLGRIVDWTATSADVLQDNADQHDEELQRVLRESAQEATVNPSNIQHNSVSATGITSHEMWQSTDAQESGVLSNGDTAPVHFGPANRDMYDTESWAMVPTGAAVQHASSVPSEPKPSARQRATGAPAFLIQQPSQWSTRLGGILTIFHEIPLARRLLLETGTQAPSYGHSATWWKGDRIYPPHTLAMLQNAASEESIEASMDFQEEVHRLMAFLDSTERSYGSIDALTSALSTGNTPVADRFFFDEWLRLNDEETLRPMLHQISQLVTKTFEVSETADTVSFLDIELTANQWVDVKSLNDMWDVLFWSDALSWQEVNDHTKMTTLDEMGEVMTLRIDGESPQFPGSVDLPEVWYPERYLSARKEEGRQIQEQMAWAAGARYRGLQLQVQLSQWEDPKTGKVWTRDQIATEVETWESIVKWFDSKEQYQPSLVLPEQLKEEIERLDLPPVYGETDVVPHGKAKEYYTRVKAVLEHIDSKLANLKAELDQVQAYKEHLRGLLTEPNDEGAVGPFVANKYLLRGVATAQNVIYVVKRAEPNLIELDDASPEPVDQWWRLAYVPEEAEPIVAEKVSSELVHRQMFQESKSVVAVYATEAALDGRKPFPLTDPLQRFVKADNKSFRAEINREKNESQSADASNGAEQVDVTPLSPSKRKYRSNSVDSMATNRASLGNSDTNSRAGDFDFGYFDGDDVMRDESGKDGPAVTEMHEFPRLSNTINGTGQKADGDIQPPLLAPTTDSLSSFPALDGQVAEGGPPKRNVLEDTLLPQGPEMKERSGSSPFLGARHGPAVSEAKPPGDKDEAAMYSFLNESNDDLVAKGP